MAGKLTHEKTITRLGKDFDQLKTQLMDFAQAFQSGSFQDFNESSPGMALLEHVAYVGDILNYNLDQVFNEIKFETSRQVENVASFAKSLGYRPRGKRAAVLDEVFMIQVPATTNANGEIVPDDAYTPILKMGARVGGPNSTLFESLEDIHFTASLGRAVTASLVDPTSGLPTHFALAKSVTMVAGETKEESFVVGAFEQFRTIELTNADVTEIISVVDSDGNDWTEVDYLAQDVVFDGAANVDGDNDVVPYILKLRTVPRRFVTDYDSVTAKMSLIFGSGDGISYDDELVPNIADLALPIYGRSSFTNFTIDPQNFLKTSSLGLSPFNTTITVKYRVGGGAETNVMERSVKNPVDIEMEFSSTGLDAAKVGTVESSVECRNPKKSDGGAPPETISEIKQNASANFSAQSRVVTVEDYVARISSLPAKFGKPEKVAVRRSQLSPLSIDAYVLAKDVNLHLTTASANLKRNISTYLSRFRMMTDGVNILDGMVTNLKVSFGVVVGSKNRNEVLVRCIDTISSELHVDKMQIGQPISISALQAKIQAITGVISVYELVFTNMFGTVDGLEYSSARFDVWSNIANNILYCPDNTVFEVKYPRRDIVGVAR